jgi:hypothetical protein
VCGTLDASDGPDDDDDDDNDGLNEKNTEEEAEDITGAVETLRATSKASDGPIMAIDESDVWHDIEEGRLYVEVPGPILSYEQKSTMSALTTDARLQSLSVPGLPKAQIHQPASMSQTSHADHGWTGNELAELEREVDLGYGNCSTKLEESASASRQGTPTSTFEEQEPQEEELVAELEVVELLQQENDSSEQTADLASVKGTDDAEMEATSSLRSGQLDINENYNHEITMGKLGDKREHQDAQTDISTETQHSLDSDGAGDTDDEEPRPAKRRRRRSAPVVAAPIHPPKPHVSSSTADFEAGDGSSTEPVLAAEYDEWPFQGFLKRTTIGDDITYNLELKLPRASEHPSQAISPEALEICTSRATISKPPAFHRVATHSKVHQTLLQPRKKNTKWTEVEEAKVIRMKDRGCSWEEINKKLPYRSIGTIQVRYYTKLRGSCL